MESRILLSTVSWISDGDGFWDDASKWSTGTVPGTLDDVVIDRPLANVTVTYRQGTNSVNSLRSAEEFVLTGGGFSVVSSLQVESLNDRARSYDTIPGRKTGKMGGEPCFLG